MKVEIKEEEKNNIIEMLKKAIEEISVEIHHCRTNDFKDYLKEQSTKVESLLEKIKAA